jgi:hypothetical protein
MSDAAEHDFRLDLFHGQFTRSSADIYARLSGDFDAASVWNDGWRLSGYIEGPRAENSHTLPAQVRMQDMGAGESLLSRVRLPDPCSWNPDLPLLYDVHVQLLVDEEPTWERHQAIGLRQLGVLEDRLQLENKPWSLMGAHQQRLGKLDLPPADQVLMLEGIQLSLLEQSSVEGSWLVTLLDGSASTTVLAAMLRECARSVANWCVVLRDVEAGCQVPTGAAPNLLLGQWFSAAEEIEPAEWADIAFVEMDDPAGFSERTNGCPLPVIAMEQGTERGDWDDARTACKQLRHQLAAFRQFAGYIVV